MRLPWKIETMLGYRPERVYKDIFEFERTGHKSLLSLRKIDSARLFNLELPKYYNAALPERFHLNDFKAYPDVYLAELRKLKVGMVDFRVGLIAADNGLLLDLSPDHTKRKQHPFLSHKDCRAKKVLKGKSLVLAAPTGNGNYYHWMFHVIGRLSVLKALEMNIEAFDHIVVNKIYKDFQQQSLVDFNFPIEKIVYLDNNEFIEIEHATVPSYLYFHPMVPHFLKKHYLKNVEKSPNSPSKIYISRRKSKLRKLRQEDKLVEFLTKKLNYVEVYLEDLTVHEQAKLLYNAEYVIALHGAGCANFIYCRPGARVMEVLQRNWMNVIYWIYANFQNLEYSCYITGITGEEIKNNVDYDVDLDDLKSFLIRNGF